MSGLDRTIGISASKEQLLGILPAKSLPWRGCTEACGGKNRWETVHGATSLHGEGTERGRKVRLTCWASFFLIDHVPFNYVSRHLGKQKNGLWFTDVKFWAIKGLFQRLREATGMDFFFFHCCNMTLNILLRLSGDNNICPLSLPHTRNEKASPHGNSARRVHESTGPLYPPSVFLSPGVMALGAPGSKARYRNRKVGEGGVFLTVW